LSAIEQHQRLLHSLLIDHKNCGFSYSKRSIKSTHFLRSIAVLIWNSAF